MEETFCNQAQSRYPNPAKVAIPSQFELLDHVPIGVCVLQADGTVLFWNSVLEEWTTITKTALVGKQISDYIPQFAQMRDHDRLKAVFEHGETVVFPSQLYPHFIPAYLPNGKLRMQHTIVTPLPALAGTGFDALISVQDLTHPIQHLAEHQFAQEKAWFVIHNHQPAEDLPKPDRDPIHNALDDLTDRPSAQETLQLHDKPERLLETMVQHIRQSLELTQILQATVTEIQQFLVADRVFIYRLAAHNTQQSVIVEACFPGCPVFLGETIDHVSANCKDYLNPYQTDRVLAIDDISQTHFDPTYLELLQKSQVQSWLSMPIVLQHKDPHSNEQSHRVWGFLIVHQCRSQRQWQSWEISLLKRFESQLAVAIQQAELYQQVRELNTDLERRVQERTEQVYRATQAQVKELEKLNHLKDDFLSTVSHELRTPLANIRMSIQLLEILIRQEQSHLVPQSGADQQETDQIEQCLTILRDECDREISLVSDILALQHLEAGTQPLQSAPIQLQDWILQITESFEEKIKQHRQVLKVAIASELPAIVSDTVMLARVLNEVLTNAYKFTPEQEQIIVSAERVVLSQLTSVVQIKVENFGVAIDSNELEQIFQQFYRIPNHDPWKHSGTGMGLALVRKLVTYLGGSVWAESEAKSVRFIVQLPLNYSPPGVKNEYR